MDGNSINEANTFFLWDLRIDEPVVAFTDLIVSALCMWFAFRLHRTKGLSSPQVLFKYYFLTMGFATLFGGLFGHAFLYALSMHWKLPGWITSMLSIMLIERAAIRHTRILFSNKIIRSLVIINLLEFATFFTLTIWTLDFFFVEFHSGYGLMFVVLGLEGFLFLKTKNIASRQLLTGIGLAAIAALVFMNEWSPHQWFNHIALSHMFIAIAAFFFYDGAQKIEMVTLNDD